MSAIDDSKLGLHLGGNLSDIPLPHVRLFDDKRRKREVKVTITRYYGIGLHYFVNLEEEDNPIINGDKLQWCWDDDEKRGRVEGYKCGNLVSAHRWIKSALKKYFPPATHKYKYEKEFLSEVDQGAWFGHLKEGD